MDTEAEIEKLTTLCRNMGAGEQQAATMAKQLIKRADQLAIERDISRVAAMEYLLELLVSGRQGEVPASFESQNSENDDTS